MTGHVSKCALVVAAALGFSVPAQAASWLEQNFWMSGPRYSAVLPPCESGLGLVQSRFATKESRFWNSSLHIVDFERVREIAFMPWQDGARDVIPRRYCSAVALVSDGRKRRVYYSIIEDAGLIGASWGVEWCVAGLDRNWAYNPKCEGALP